MSSAPNRHVASVTSAGAAWQMSVFPACSLSFVCPLCCRPSAKQITSLPTQMWTALPSAWWLHFLPPWTLRGWKGSFTFQREKAKLKQPVWAGLLQCPCSLLRSYHINSDESHGQVLQLMEKLQSVTPYKKPKDTKGQAHLRKREFSGSR